MTCPNCKKVYNDKVTICISCGSELVPDVKDEAAEGIFETEPPVYEEEITIRNISMTQPQNVIKAVPLKSTAGNERKDTSSLTRIFIRVAASILLFCVAVLFFFSFTLRQLTKEQHINHIVKNFDLMSLPVDEFIPVKSSQTISEAVAVMADGSGLDSQRIKSIYETSTVKDHLCRVISQYGRYLRTGETPDTVNVETVKNVLTENISVIGVLGYDISENDLSIAYGYIENMAPVIEAFSVKSIESDYGGAVSFARAFISIPVIVAEITAAVMFVILTGAISRSTEKMMFFTGTALSAAGLVIIGTVFMFTMQIGVFSVDSIVLKELIKSVSAAMTEVMYAVGGITAVSGGAALIWAVTLRRTRKQLS